MGRKKERMYDRKTCQVFRLIPHSEQPDDVQMNDGQSIAPSTVFRSDQEKFATQSVYGISYQDDYDYMQHLREGGSHIVELQPVAMASKIPRKTILESEMPGFSEDPDIMCELLDPDQVDEEVDALLDSDAELTDEGMDDDFVIKADAVIAYDGNPFTTFRSVKNEKTNEQKIRLDIADDDDEDDEYRDEMSEAPTSFKRPKGSHLKRKLPEEVENHFDKVLLNYDEDDLSEEESLSGDKSDDEESENPSEIVEFAEKWKHNEEEFKAKLEEEVNDRSDHTQITKMLAERMQQEDTTSFDKLYVEDDEKNDKWDCESILTTVSTLYNHPTSICEPKQPRFIKLNKHGIPIDSKSSGRLGEKLRRLNEEMEVDYDDESIATTRSKASTYRPPNETKGERRQRKQAVKAERKERREEKKMNKLAFKQEFLRHHQNKTANPQKGIVM